MGMDEAVELHYIADGEGRGNFAGQIPVPFFTDTVHPESLEIVLGKFRANGDTIRANPMR